jgi:hypothetical protein
MRPKPLKQGDATGLCSVYAVVNAVRYLWPELCDLEADGYTEHGSKYLFRYLISEQVMNGEQFRKLFNDGDDFWDGDLNEELLEAALSWLKRSRGLNGSYRSIKLGSHPRQAVQAQLKPSVVVVLGLGKPCPHYTVATHRGVEGLRLFDSDVFTAIEAGERWEFISALRLERLPSGV